MKWFTHSKIAVVLGIAVLAAAHSWAEEDPKLKEAKEKIKKRAEQIKTLLEEKRVTHTFKGMTFPAAIGFLQKTYALEIVIDPVVDAADHKVLVDDVKNISLKSALRLVCGTGLVAQPRGEAVFISTTKGGRQMRSNANPLPAEPTKIQEKIILAIHQNRTAASFDKKPVKEALGFLEKKSLAKIRVKPSPAIDKMTVSVSVKDASLRSLLDLVCGSRLGWRVEDDLILVGLPGDIKEKPKPKPKKPAKKAAPSKPKAAPKKAATPAKKGVEKKAPEKPKDKKPAAKKTPTPEKKAP